MVVVGDGSSETRRTDGSRERVVAVSAVLLGAIALPSFAIFQLQKRGHPPLRHRPSLQGRGRARDPGIVADGAFPGDAWSLGPAAMFRSLEAIVASDPDQLVLNEVEKLREVLNREAFAGRRAGKQIVRLLGLGDLLLRRGAIGHLRGKAPRGLKLPDKHRARRCSDEHPGRAVRAEGGISDGIDGVHSRAEVTADYEVVISPVAASEVIRRVDDSANELNKTSFGERIRITVEVPPKDPWPSDGAEASSGVVEHFHVEGVRRAKPVVKVQGPGMEAVFADGTYLLELHPGLDVLQVEVIGLADTDV